MAVRIVTDSACDLPEEICTELGIEVVPLTIRFGEREYVDRVELSVDAFWRELLASPVLPETAAPSVGAFEEAFRRVAAEGADGIVCVNLSSRLSATMQSAQLAAKSLEGEIEIAVVDSLNASMGEGNLALLGARTAAAGGSVAEIVAAIESARERLHVFATLDTLEYLRKGGRIGGGQAMLGSVLSIKPVVSVVDGTVEPVGKVRTRSKALQAVLERVPTEPGAIESVCVLHAGAPEIDSFVADLRAIIGDVDVLVGTIGPVVGVHTGPRVLGLAYIQRA